MEGILRPEAEVMLYLFNVAQPVSLGGFPHFLPVRKCGPSGEQAADFGGEAKETIPCTFTSDALEIGFNSAYLIDILSHLESEQVTFRFSTPTRKYSRPWPGAAAALRS